MAPLLVSSTSIVGGTREYASPHGDWASPHRDLSVPPSRFKASPTKSKLPTHINDKVAGLSKIMAEDSTILQWRPFFWSSPEFKSKIRIKGRKHRIWSKFFTRLLPDSECVWSRLRKRPHAIFHGLNAAYKAYCTVIKLIKPTVISTLHNRQIRTAIEFKILVGFVTYDNRHLLCSPSYITMRITWKELFSIFWLP